MKNNLICLCGGLNICVVHSISWTLSDTNSSWCQMDTYKCPVNKTCTTKKQPFVDWAALFPTENPSNKGNMVERRPWWFYLIPPCHSHGTYINHCPTASDLSSALDTICHRSVDVDKLLRSFASLRFPCWVLIKMICSVSEKWLLVAEKIGLAIKNIIKQIRMDGRRGPKVCWQ